MGEGYRKRAVRLGDPLPIFGDEEGVPQPGLGYRRGGTPYMFWGPGGGFPEGAVVEHWGILICPENPRHD